MLSVVVVVHDSEAVVAPCLRSVAEFLPDAEIIVVDNASRDGTKRVVAEAVPHARILDAGTNAGFGRSNNAGVAAASYPHVLILNPDVTVTGVDRAALGALLAEKPFGLVAATLDGLEIRRAHTSWLRDLAHHTIGVLRPRELAPRIPLAPSGDGWVGAAMLLLERGEFDAVGRFDPRFFLYYEDRDLARRYQAAGLPVRTTRALAGAHAGGASGTYDALRSAPMTWSLLGWIQYLAIHEGEDAARRAASVSLRTLRALRGILGLAPARGRIARKRRQLDEVLGLTASLTAAGGDFWPDASRIVRALDGAGAASREAA
jgi:GT2 family glycosyltransferase